MEFHQVGGKTQFSRIINLAHPMGQVIMAKYLREKKKKKKRQSAPEGGRPIAPIGEFCCFVFSGSFYLHFQGITSFTLQTQNK